MCVCVYVWDIAMYFIGKFSFRETITFERTMERNDQAKFYLNDYDSYREFF